MAYRFSPNGYNNVLCSLLISFYQEEESISSSLEFERIGDSGRTDTTVYDF